MRLISKPGTDAIAPKELEVDPGDLKEIFGLFTSCTDFERAQIYDPASHHFFEDVDLDEEYSLTAEKREYALDALRAVLTFLHSKGLQLTDHSEAVDLSGFTARLALLNGRDASSRPSPPRES